MPLLRLLIPLLLLTACTTLPDGAPTADERLVELYETEYAWRQEQQGRALDDDGNWTSGERFPDVSPEAYAARIAYWDETLQTLAAIPRDELSDAERINAAVFEQIVTSNVEDARFRTYEAPLNSDSFFWGYLAPNRGFADADAYERYIGRLEDLPRYFDQHMDNMRAGLARGYTPPAVTLQGRETSIKAYLASGDANPFARAVARFPNRIPEEEQARLRTDVLAAIDAHVVPAYTKLLAFMREEYLPNARTTLAESGEKALGPR